MEFKDLFYLSYTPESTTVFCVSFSLSLWNMMWSTLTAIYYFENSSKPKKVLPIVQELKKEIEHF